MSWAVLEREDAGVLRVYFGSKARKKYIFLGSADDRAGGVQLKTSGIEISQESKLM